MRQLVWRHYEVSRVGRTHRALAAATPYHAVLPATPMSTPKLRGCMAWLRRLQLASLDIRAPLSQQRLTLMLQPLAELAPQHAGLIQRISLVALWPGHVFDAGKMQASNCEHAMRFDVYL